MSSLKSVIKEKFPRLFSLLGGGKRLVRNILVEHQKKSLRKKIEGYYANNPEAEEVISFLRSHPIEMIPYFYTDEYKGNDIVVTRQDDLYSVMVKGNDIFFPSEMSREYVAESVRYALMEQDARSPHKYLPVNSITVLGDVAVLCGASDCIYALQIVENFNKIYLFEANKAWINPIKKTLRNYLHKIEIVPYFISDKNGPDTITLDSFFEKKGHPDVNYIQADIEGHELNMLKGAVSLLERSTNLKLALCCYHTPHQQKELTEFLTAHGYNVRNSEGFLLMWMDYPLLPPYLRRGVLYASK